MNISKGKFLRLNSLIVAFGFISLILLGAIVLVTAQTEETRGAGFPKLENPRIVIKKSQRQLELFDCEKLVKTYTVALGFSPVSDKEIQGDGKTPEGNFYIFTKNNQSRFYLSLGLSYPNIEDAERGVKAGIITRKQRDAIAKAIKENKMPPQNTRLGGEIYIHGGGISSDWTWGCTALKNEEIKELFEAVSVGTKVKIEP